MTEKGERVPATGREAALCALLEWERRRVWAEDALKKQLERAALERREAALATRLVFSVLQNKNLLNWYINNFTRKKLDIEVRVILQLGACQILLFERIPDSAVVNESVKLTRQYCENPGVPGFVNAILRNVSREKDTMALPVDLATRYSHPQWLVNELTKRRSPQAIQAVLEWNNSPAPTTAQVNILRTSAEQLRKELEAGGVLAEPHPWLPDCLELRRTGDMRRLPCFQQGRDSQPDAAAQLPVRDMNKQPGMRVLDLCAAPGGKSFAAAVAMKDRGEIFSCDISPERVALIEEGARRLGFRSIHAQTQDALQRRENWREGFDAVIADVPCSGLGIIRKKPDIRYRPPGLLVPLPKTQSAILENAAYYVRPGGILLYATCTLLRRENEGVTEIFLKNHPEFSLEEFHVPDPVGKAWKGQITLWPDRHGTDGFFIAKMRKAE
ncbi:MAG: 16S rRNA (cytosine(967)-C(5))-methyltransferase RsmB [Oscillospiraceae bacterium]|nr:16S rRNA (cytosine(967)-C(5))-methyltransferase RsmB [Oscillospiraceae bacterium]